MQNRIDCHTNTKEKRITYINCYVKGSNCGYEEF